MVIDEANFRTVAEGLKRFNPFMAGDTVEEIVADMQHQAAILMNEQGTYRATGGYILVRYHRKSDEEFVVVAAWADHLRIGEHRCACGKAT